MDVHREPVGGTWQSIRRYGRGEVIRMLAFPDVAIAVDEILPPRG